MPGSVAGFTAVAAAAAAAAAAARKRLCLSEVRRRPGTDVAFVCDANRGAGVGSDGN